MLALLSKTSVQGPWTWHAGSSPVSRAAIYSACRQPAAAWRCPKMLGSQRLCRGCDCPCWACASMSRIWTIYMTGLQVGLRTTGSLLYQCSYHAQSALSGGMRSISAVLSVWIFWLKFCFIYATLCLSWGEEVEGYWVVTVTVDVEKRVSFVNWTFTPRRFTG